MIRLAFPAFSALAITPEKKFPDREEYLDEMEETEREELIGSLKAKWDAINKKYQLLVRSFQYFELSA